MRNKAALILTSLFLLLGLLGAACGAPSRDEINVQAEQIAAPIISTWQAQAPTLTPRPTRTPTATPTTTSTPTPSPTPLPTATVTPTATPTPRPSPTITRTRDLAATQVLRLAACCAGADLEWTVLAQ
jgi:hypothetical protein